MTHVVDFRKTTVFSPDRIDKCGNNIGKRVYPKLYVIENLMRIILHSILTAQLGGGWWGIAVDPIIQKNVTRSRNRYLARPWHTNPGNHDIYYVDLGGLLEITRANAHLLSPVIVDINNWVAQIDSIRLPRNVVAHMNFSNPNDRKRIDLIHHDLKTLVVSLQKNQIITFQIP